MPHHKWCQLLKLLVHLARGKASLQESRSPDTTGIFHKPPSCRLESGLVSESQAKTPESRASQALGGRVNRKAWALGEEAPINVGMHGGQVRIHR